MNLIPSNIWFLFKPVRTLALFGCVTVFLGLNATVLAAEPSSAILQTNGVAAGSNGKAGTNAMTEPSRPATNRLNADSITNTSATATNLSQTSGTNPAVVLDDKYKLAIGDRLSFRILEDEDDSKPQDDLRPFFVTDSGELEVPYIGRIPAENKTCQQLAAEIKTALEKEYYYQATVIIAVDLMSKTRGRVYLVGAVRLPGPVELPGDEVLTLSKAILRAGGFTDYANRSHVKVTRKENQGKDDKKTFDVDVGKIFDKGKVETDLILEPGDLVFVPDRLVRF